MQLKSINTCIEHFGVKYSLQSPEIREKGNNSKQLNHGDKNFNNRHKSKETCLNKYGVEHISQVPDIFKKQRKSSLSIKKFKDTNIWYQGSYEQDFLEKYYVIYPDIQRASPIKYQYKGKNKIYYPDFYIPSLNLIIEIKNKWLAKKDKEIISAKENAAIMNGFNYIMIIEKNYELFPTS